MPGCIVHRKAFGECVTILLVERGERCVCSFVRSLAHTTDYVDEYYTTNHHASDHNRVLGRPVGRDWKNDSLGLGFRGMIIKWLQGELRFGDTGRRKRRDFLVTVVGYPAMAG